MDKNSKKDTFQFFKNYGWNIMPIISSLAGWLVKEIFSVNFWITWIFVFAGMFIFIHIINEIMWSIKRKNGFVDVFVSPDDDNITEHEKVAYLGVSLKDAVDKIKLHVIIHRVTHGVDNIEFGDLSFFNGSVYIVKDLNLESYMKKISVMSIIEDHAFVITEDGKRDLRIFLDNNKSFSLERCELFFEIKGIINEKYVFSEFYKGGIVYQCSTEPNIFIGQDKKPFRSSQMKWEYFYKWSIEEENKRPILREIRNFADRTYS